MGMGCCRNRRTGTGGANSGLLASDNEDAPESGSKIFLKSVMIYFILREPRKVSFISEFKVGGNLFISIRAESALRHA